MVGFHQPFAHQSRHALSLPGGELVRRNHEFVGDLFKVVNIGGKVREEVAGVGIVPAEPIHRFDVPHSRQGRDALLVGDGHHLRHTRGPVDHHAKVRTVCLADGFEVV